MSGLVPLRSLRSNVSMAFFVLLVMSFLGSQIARAQNNHPNIVFFLADDMGWGDTRVNNPDSKIPMPNLELLAQHGMNFTDAHTPAAKCAPTLLLD